MSVSDGWRPHKVRSWLTGGTTAGWAPRAELGDDGALGPPSRSTLLQPPPPSRAVPYMGPSVPHGVSMPRSVAVGSAGPSIQATASRARNSSARLGSLYHGRVGRSWASDAPCAEGVGVYEDELAAFDKRVDAYLKGDGTATASAFDVDMWLMQRAPKLP